MFQFFCIPRFSNMSFCYCYNQKVIKSITKTDEVSELFFLPQTLIEQIEQRSEKIPE